MLLKVIFKNSSKTLTSESKNNDLKLKFDLNDILFPNMPISTSVK